MVQNYLPANENPADGVIREVSRIIRTFTRTKAFGKITIEINYQDGRCIVGAYQTFREIPWMATTAKREVEETEVA